MKNFRKIIKAHLSALSSSARIVENPNKSIEEVIGKDVNLHWYPPYLAKDETTFFLFYPFSFEEFIDEAEVREGRIQERVYLTQDKGPRYQYGD